MTGTGRASTMRYPALEINLKKITANTEVEVEYFRKHGIQIMGVNKVFSGLPQTAEAVYRGGISVVAESVLDNLKKLKYVPCQKALIKSPGLSEIGEVVAWADICTVSEKVTIEALSREGVKQGRTTKLLLMVDMGDLREGIWFEEYQEIREAIYMILTLPGVELYGLGTNYGCFGTVLPTRKSALDFVALAEKLEKELGFQFPYLSGGNCSSFNLVDGDQMPQRINHLRIGGQHLFGIEYVEGKYLDGYHHSQKVIEKYVSDIYVLKGEVTEVRKKPTVPVGPLGMDAFMKEKVFEDKGIRRQCLLNFGLQEVPWENIHPVDEKILVLGQTSNHTVLDVEDAEKEYEVGDIISFEVDYTALMFLCNTPHIQKIFI